LAIPATKRNRRSCTFGANGRAITVVLKPLLAGGELLAMQSVTERIFVEPSIETYIVSLVRATREEMHVGLGASPRASLGLMRMSSALAAMEGRSFVTPDDVKACAVPILAHRLMLRPESWGGRISTRGIVTSILGRVPAPAVELA
jgi:MoxR-like ATPase